MGIGPSGEHSHRDHIGGRDYLFGDGRCICGEAMNRLVAALIVMSIPSPALAHPGGLDSNGGHNQRGGGYHYHRGGSGGGSSEVLLADFLTAARTQARSQARMTARVSARDSADNVGRREEKPAKLSDSPRSVPPRKPELSPEDWRDKWQQDARIWTSVSGSTLIARLLSAVGSGDDRVLSLERDDRIVLRVPIVKLIHEDRLYVDNWARKRS